MPEAIKRPKLILSGKAQKLFFTIDMSILLTNFHHILGIEVVHYRATCGVQGLCPIFRFLGFCRFLISATEPFNWAEKKIGIFRRLDFFRTEFSYVHRTVFSYVHSCSKYPPGMKLAAAMLKSTLNNP